MISASTKTKTSHENRNRFMVTLNFVLHSVKAKVNTEYRATVDTDTAA